MSPVAANAIHAVVGAADENAIFEDLMRFKPDDLSPNAWAISAGVSRTVWSDIRRHGNPSRRTLEKLLGAAGSSLAEFEALRLGPRSRATGGAAADRQFADMRLAWRAAPLPPIPLFGSSLGGQWGEHGAQVEMTVIQYATRLEQLPRPASLAGDSEAFALTVVGDAMRPRFRPGTRIAVSPRAPVAIGDDVLAELRSNASGENQALILHLAKRTAAKFELCQYNPDVTIRVDAARFDRVSKIVGELI